MLISDAGISTYFLFGELFHTMGNKIHTSQMVRLLNIS